MIVGAGPAGLSAAIRLKQLAAEKNSEIEVCVVEKGSHVGAHILSGNVFEPRGLNELIPDWKEKGAPLTTPVTADHMKVYLNQTRSFTIPHIFMPKEINNVGNYIISLGQLCQWLGE